MSHPTHQPRQDQPNLRLIRSAADLDILIGMLAFWTLVLFIATVWMEVTGQDALGWALGLLAAILALWGLIRLRRTLPSRTLAVATGLQASRNGSRSGRRDE